MRTFLGVFGCLLLVCGARAHDPLDCSARITVGNDRIEVAVTMGLDGVRQFLAGAGFSPEKIAESVKARGPHSSVEQPAALAPHFVHLKKDGEIAAAKSVTSFSDGTEVVFTLSYPRAATAGVLDVRAVCYETVPGLRPGAWFVYDDARGQVEAVVLSRTKATLAVPLPAARSDSGR